MALSEEQLNAHRAKHGRIKHVEYNGVDLVFRKPSRAEVKIHQRARENPQEKTDADEHLAQALVIQCGKAVGGDLAREAFLQLLDEYPYACESQAIGHAIAKLSGLMLDEEAKTSAKPSMPNGASPTATPEG